jgi:homoserine acetyltransferase
MSRAWISSVFGAVRFREGHWKKTAPTLDEFLVKEVDATFGDWDANDLMILMNMWKMGDIGSFRQDGDLHKVLEDVDVPVLVIPSLTDSYFV